MVAQEIRLCPQTRTRVKCCWEGASLAATRSASVAQPEKSYDEDV